MNKRMLPTYSALLFSVGDERTEFSYYGFKNNWRSIILARETINFRRFGNDLVLKDVECRIDHIRKIKTYSNTEKKKWWSYCPDWVFLQPYFIHEVIRPYLMKELEDALDGIFVHDLGEKEIIRLKFWMRILSDRFLESPEPSNILEKHYIQ